MCLKHNKTLGLFCKTDQTCVCSICTVSEHKTHEFVPLGQECVQKKAELQKEIKEQIDDRHVFISNFNDSIGLGQTNADRKIAGGVHVFISLMDMVEKGMENLVNSIEESHRMAQEVLQLHIKGLEKEIIELQKRNTEVQDVSLSGDPFQLLQSLQSMNIHHALRKNWPEVSLHPPFLERSVVRAVAQLEMKISQTDEEPG